MSAPPFVTRIGPETSREEIGQIIQEAVTYCSDEIMELLTRTHPADVPILAACSDSIRAALMNMHPEIFGNAEKIKRNMITIVVRNPGGPHNGRQE